MVETGSQPMGRSSSSPVLESGDDKRYHSAEGRDFFLSRAWDDRAGAAKELYGLLQSRGVSIWFSEKDIGLGTPFLREIDKGLVKSKV
jgi:hypothetical protein